MLQCTADKGAKPDRVWSQFGDYATDAVGHLQIQGDEIKPINVLPIVKVLVDGVGVGIERLGEETLLLGRAQCVLLEEVVFVHDTDFF